MKNTALIIVDMQNDFVLPSGSLYVPNAEKLIDGISKTIHDLEQQSIIITTQDWHPANHSQFLPAGQWPSHCVQETEGADIVKELRDVLPEDTINIYKGDKKDHDGYSGFEGHTWAWVATLADVLKAYAIVNVYVCGVATDYCVRATALDAQKLGYKTHLITNCIAGVTPDTSDTALAEMSQAGIVPIQFHTK